MNFKVDFNTSNTSFDGGMTESSINFDTDFSVNETEIEDSTFGQGALGSLLKHSLLQGRDNPDQHPITAVTGLEAELETRPSKALSNLELESLLK